MNRNKVFREQVIKKARHLLDKVMKDEIREELKQLGEEEQEGHH